MRHLRDAVVILATNRDLTVDHVVAELHERDVPTARMDVADFPKALTLTAELGEAGWGGTLRDGYRSVDLSSVRSIYYRRPGQFRLADGMSVTEQGWAYREARTGFGGTLLGLDCFWLNDPRVVASAEYKPAQLAAARKAGLSVPDTIVTNDPEHAHDWAGNLDDPVVYKPLGGVLHVEEGRSKIIFANVLDAAEQVDDPSLSLTSHCLQAWVSDKTHEVRVTIVGERMFAVAIHAETDEAYQDWRRDYAAHRYEVVDVSPEIRGGLRRYMASWGLSFGAADFVVRTDGSWVFLELNPNGEWGWLAYHCDLPIASAIADLLEKGGLT